MQTTNQSTNQTTSQSAKPNDRPTDQPTDLDLLTDQPAHQPTDQLTNYPTNQQIVQSKNRQIVHPTKSLRMPNQVASIRKHCNTIQEFRFCAETFDENQTKQIEN